jgi:hypothetical protein
LISFKKEGAPEVARIYRSMTKDGDEPKVGPSARSLGVRVPNDIPAPDGKVTPGSGGMSVAPAWGDLPPWRIPGDWSLLLPTPLAKMMTFAGAWAKVPSKLGSWSKDLCYGQIAHLMAW